MVFSLTSRPSNFPALRNALAIMISAWHWDYGQLSSATPRLLRGCGQAFLAAKGPRPNYFTTLLFPSLTDWFSNEGPLISMIMLNIKISAITLPIIAWPILFLLLSNITSPLRIKCFAMKRALPCLSDEKSTKTPETSCLLFI